MFNGQEPTSLSAGDALFLYLEREGTPLNVASVLIFEGIIPREACSDFIESKLSLIPRYRQRAVATPLNIGLPAWEYDPDFDIRNHIHEVALRRGTEAELKTVAGRILSATMDRRRPLWDFTLLRGLKDDRTAILARVHHCLLDGVAGVGLMNVIMDSTPVPPPRPRKQDYVPPAPCDPLARLLDQLITGSFSTVQRLLKAQSDWATLVEQVVAAFGQQPVQGNCLHSSVGDARPKSIPDLLSMVPELTAPAERLPFNVVCRGPQKFHWAEIPLAGIKAVRQACGATVNDVVLAIITGAFRRYAELHDVRLAGRRLRIVVPVNVRGNGSTDDLGNRITFVPVAVPLDLVNPRKLVAAVHQRMEFLKTIRVAELIGLAGSLLGTIPPPLQAVLGPIASQLPLSVCNLICTNVPGPQVPLYLLGHKMLKWYPYVPIGGEMGINCAVLSYDGNVYFGFTGDAHAAPDVACLEKFVRASFAELRKGAGIRAPRQKRAHKRTEPEQRTEPEERTEAAASPNVVATPEAVPLPSPVPADKIEERERELRAAVGA